MPILKISDLWGNIVLVLFDGRLELRKEPKSGRKNQVSQNGTGNTINYINLFSYIWNKYAKCFGGIFYVKMMEAFRVR